MNLSWELTLKYLEKELGGHVDWNEYCFECPECGELVYESDLLGWFASEECPFCGWKFNNMED